MKLTGHVSSPWLSLLPPFLPPLEDDPPQDDHHHVEHVEHHEPHGIVDGHGVGPEEIEGPIHRKDVEDDVTQEGTLSQHKRFGHCHRSDDYCGHKDASSCNY